MKKIIELLLPYLIGGGLLAGFVFSCNKAMKEAQDKKRIEAALVTSKTPAKTFTAKNGLVASKTDVQGLTTREVKTIYPGVIKAADNVNVKPGQIMDYSRHGVALEQIFTIPIFKLVLKDTTKKVDSIHYKDPWTELSGTIKNDTLKLNLQSFDTITRFIHKGDRVHPWLWILSRRKVQQTIINSNPHTKIVFQEAIKTL